MSHVARHCPPARLAPRPCQTAAAAAVCALRERVRSVAGPGAGRASRGCAAVPRSPGSLPGAHGWAPAAAWRAWRARRCAAAMGAPTLACARCVRRTEPRDYGARPRQCPCRKEAAGTQVREARGIPAPPPPRPQLLNFPKKVKWMLLSLLALSFARSWGLPSFASSRDSTCCGYFWCSCLDNVVSTGFHRDFFFLLLFFPLV